ncbi:hypothetical protein Vafri_5394 [Volvox africanus]|nr:hypothetical protein Vafri_5394 [Volvox africanus]
MLSGGKTNVTNPGANRARHLHGSHDSLRLAYCRLRRMECSIDPPIDAVPFGCLQVLLHHPALLPLPVLLRCIRPLPLMLFLALLSVVAPCSRSCGRTGGSALHRAKLLHAAGI